MKFKYCKKCACMRMFKDDKCTVCGREMLRNKIIAYENGDMGIKEEIRFFQELVDADLAFRLPYGLYGRFIEPLIEEGTIKPNTRRTYE